METSGGQSDAGRRERFNPGIALKSRHGRRNFRMTGSRSLSRSILLLLILPFCFFLMLFVLLLFFILILILFPAFVSHIVTPS